jgi:hypothetical protein
MCTVFWDLDEGSLIPSTQGTKNTRGLGGDFIGPVSLQPDIFQGALVGSFSKTESCSVHVCDRHLDSEQQI